MKQMRASTTPRLPVGSLGIHPGIVGGVKFPRIENHFVVQEHQARTHHFDFRLERNGVLKSWALPRGLPEIPGERRLAIAVEDHPLSWTSFEGVIPADQYGAGTVKIWDRGTYRLHHWSESKIVFSLSGEILEGRFVLVRYTSSGPTHWLLIKTPDNAE
jgi:DNA ligase D-like protein (predicted 3'-phosphoesterase)